MALKSAPKRDGMSHRQCVGPLKTTPPLLWEIAHQRGRNISSFCEILLSENFCNSTVIRTVTVNSEIVCQPRPSTSSQCSPALSCMWGRRPPCRGEKQRERKGRGRSRKGRGEGQDSKAALFSYFQPILTRAQLPLS